MQLFLPFPDDLDASARFLDDRRLGKQVIEACEIGRRVLNKLGHERHLSVKGWLTHPAVLFVFNNGKPKIPWLIAYIEAMESEWLHRGFNRGEAMREKLDNILSDLDSCKHQGVEEPVLSFVGFGKVVWDGSPEEIQRLYLELLTQKWEHDSWPPRCRIPGR